MMVPPNELANTTQLAVVFKAFSDGTRLKAAIVISGEEKSVQQVADTLNTTIQNASNHLRQLKAAGVASCRRDGKLVYYKLLPRAVPIIVQVQEFTTVIT